MELFHAYNNNFERVELSKTAFFFIKREVNINDAKKDYPVVMGTYETLTRFIKTPSQNFYENLLVSLKKRYWIDTDEKGYIIQLEEETIRLAKNKNGKLSMKANDFIEILSYIKYN